MEHLQWMFTVANVFLLFFNKRFMTCAICVKGVCKYLTCLTTTDYIPLDEEMTSIANEVVDPLTSDEYKFKVKGGAYVSKTPLVN